MHLLTALSHIVAEADGALFTIGGLPFHPLLVHAVVVLLPLGVLGLITIILMPKWRKHYGWLVMGALMLGAFFAALAAQTGEQLATVTGISEEHEVLGKLMAIVALVNFAVGALWFWPVHEGKEKGHTRLGSGRQAVVSIAALLLSLVSVGLIAAVGHSGAQAVWQDRLATKSAAQSTATASASPSASASASTTANGTGSGYTLADVAKHKSAADCWTAINGNVYNVTDWINRHPGGPTVIQRLCGIDGSAAFTGQHGNQGGPNGMLDTFKLGKLNG